MAATLVTTAGTCTAPTGHGANYHLIYAANSGHYWLFFVDSTNTNTIKTYYNTNGGSDISAWTAGTSKTLSNALTTNDGRNFSVTYKNISSNDVIQVACIERSASNDFPFSCRATISGTTITWGSDLNVDSTHGTNDANDPPFGIGICFDSNNKPVIFTSTGIFGGGNMSKYVATNADTGSAWTTGWNTGTSAWAPSAYVHSSSVWDIGAGATINIADNGANTPSSTGLTNVEWYVTTGATIFTAVTAEDVNSYGVAQVSTSDTHCVLRNGANTYSHKRFNGTNWTTLSGASITNQTSKAAGGFPLVSDGTNVWLFIIDSDAPNTVRYTKWNGTTWSAWSALETTTQTRSYLGLCPTVSNSQIVAYWSQTNGSNQDIYVEALSTASGVTVDYSSFAYWPI